MDIDRMAKEWPDMKRRLTALEQGAGQAQQQQYPSAATGYTPEQVDEVQRTLDSLSQNAANLIARMEEATAALQLARESLDTAMAKAQAAAEQTLGSGNQSDELLRHEAKPLGDAGL